jgi:uroporphyrinogen-III synthase
MSPSAVAATDHAVAGLPSIKGLTAFSIGPTTSEALRGCGWRGVVEAHEHSEEGVLALLKAWQGS